VPVAQVDRAPECESGGQGFKSPQARIMIIRIDGNYKPQPKKANQIRRSENTFSKSFEEIVFSSIAENEEIDKLNKKLDELESRLKEEFSSELVEEYKELIRDLIKKLSNLAKVIEKSSLKSKDKRLKVIVFANTKLRETLESLVKDHVTKAVLMNLSSELRGIIMSVLA
jgi:uncharacterized protein YaaR (DUF327 family)